MCSFLLTFNFKHFVFSEPNDQSVTLHRVYYSTCIHQMDCCPSVKLGACVVIRCGIATVEGDILEGRRAEQPEEAKL